MNRPRLPSLSALRAFEAAARHLSAKRAAQELSVTPTAVSHQVRHLERALGVALFVRRPRKLLLTPQGRELLDVLGHAFDAIGDAVARLRAPAQRSVVTLSTTPAVAVRWLLPWVCVLRDAHPKLDLRVHATHEPVALDGVTADLAIRYGGGHWPGLTAEKLFDNVFVPACSPALNLRHRTELSRHTLIHFEPPNAISAPVNWSTWQRKARVAKLDVTAGPVFSDETHAISAALDAQGVALMSRALIAAELRGGRLVQPFGPELTADAFHLVYPPARKGEPAIAAVREWVSGLPREA